MSDNTHKHDSYQCPAHIRGCGCGDPDDMICNPYHVPGHCPDDLNWMPGDEPRAAEADKGGGA